MGPSNLIKYTPLAEDTAYTSGQGCIHHLGGAAQHNGHLHLVYVVYADAGRIVGAGKAGEEFCQFGNFQRFFGDDVLLAKGDDFLADVYHIAFTKIRRYILAHQFCEIFAGLDKVGVNGASVILFSFTVRSRGFSGFVMDISSMERIKNHLSVHSHLTPQ